MSMIFQSYALWPHMTVAENVAYGLKLRKMTAATSAARSTPSSPPSCSRAGRPLPGRTLRRPAAARVARARADRGAGNAVARRAPVQPRRQPARGDALRDPPPARRLPLHHGLRHARPVRGDDHRRRHRGDEPGAIEQAGSPEDIYERPRSEFVARFIGASNIYKGKRSTTDTGSVSGRAAEGDRRPAPTGGRGGVSVDPPAPNPLLAAEPADQRTTSFRRR